MLYSVVTFPICIFLLGANVFSYINGANVDIYSFNAIRYRRQTQNTICPITQFQCDSGQCIDEIRLCDGKVDCNDNSDENIKVCDSEICPNIISFKCNYGACIHMNGRCNGLRDCFDGSDEESCPYAVAKNFEGCLHPNNPLHGKYDVLNYLSVDASNPGDIVPVFSELFLNCNKGFVIDPPEDDGPSYCLPTKVWSPAPKLCTRMSIFSAGCRLPNNPSHGKYVVINHLSDGYITGDIVPVYGLLQVHCNSGYAINPLEDDQPSYCLPTEEWAPAPKSCSLMTFVSNPSSTLIRDKPGPNSALTRINVLQGKGCQVPIDPLHGRYNVVNNNLSSNGYSKSGDVVPAHSVLHVHCYTKYKSISPADDAPTNCLPTGEWKPAPKKCEEPDFSGCIFPYINPAHGKYTVNNQLREHFPGDIIPISGSLSLNCNSEYEIIQREDEKPSICLPTKGWSPAPQNCTIKRIRSEGCILPRNPLHGKYVVMNHLSDGYIPGDIVPVYGLLQVHCNSGYIINPLEDDQPSYCLPTEEWTPAPKSCSLMTIVSKGCQVPIDPLHGRYDVVNNNLSSNGYSKSGDIVPAHSVLHVHCYTKYKSISPADDAPTNCLPTGEWKPAPKKCEEPDFSGCIFPYINPAHGKYTVNNQLREHFPGDIIPISGSLSLNCNSQYEIIQREDEKPSICLPTKGWSPAPQNCTIKRIRSEGCILPRNPLFGQYIVEYPSSLYIPGDIVPETTLISVTCNNGFQIDPTPDDKLITCLSGEWSSTLKTCKRSVPSYKICEVPSNPPNGRYNVISDLSRKYKSEDFVPSGSILSINCTTGYVANSPVIDNLFSCGDNGAWNPSIYITKCARTCPSLTSTNTTFVTCEVDGKPLKTCLNALENTIARISCAPFYEELSLERYPTRLCKDGSWQNPIPQCYPSSERF